MEKNKINFKEWLKDKNINIPKLTRYMDNYTTERFAERTFQEYLKDVK
jgi:hypothetical protein